MVAAFCIGAGHGRSLGREDGIRQVRQEAVEAGVGGWVVNPETGETAFAFSAR